MFVELTQFRYGPGFVQPAGMQIELPDDDATKLIAANGAVKIEPAAAGSQTAKRSPRKKKGKAKHE